jgi:hypothetical protein
MAQLGRNEIISTYSNPGMAGHGAYTYGGPAAGMVVGGMNPHDPMQQRPNYVYGQSYEGDDNASDHVHGAYSSQPMAQSSYNPEAYGSYAYSTQGPHAVSTDSYLDPHSQAHTSHAGRPSTDFGPLASPYDKHPEPAPPLPAGGSNLPPALVAGAPAVAAGRSTNTRSVYDDSDAYGGI